MEIEVIWHNLKKMRKTDYDFRPLFTTKFMGAENDNSLSVIVIPVTADSLTFVFHKVML